MRRAWQIRLLQVPLLRESSGRVSPADESDESETCGYFGLGPLFARIVYFFLSDGSSTTIFSSSYCRKLMTSQTVVKITNLFFATEVKHLQN